MWASFAQSLPHTQDPGSLCNPASRSPCSRDSVQLECRARMHSLLPRNPVPLVSGQSGFGAFGTFLSAGIVNLALQVFGCAEFSTRESKLAEWRLLPAPNGSRIRFRHILPFSNRSRGRSHSALLHPLSLETHTYVLEERLRRTGYN